MEQEKKQKDNLWLDDTDSTVEDNYINKGDFFIVERKRLLKILVDIFSYHFEKPENLRLLDLGCGDGIVTKEIYEKYPDNTFSLLDGSKAMIEKAKGNFKGNNFIFSHKSFKEYLSSEPDTYSYDFIYSAFAIHHLDFLEKAQLYTRIFRELNYNGLFIIIDGVTAASDRSSIWQINMWKDWVTEKINSSIVENKDTLVKEIHSWVESKNKDDMPSGLIEQMAEMKKIGFRNVDCFYKYGMFALFGGTKW